MVGAQGVKGRFEVFAVFGEEGGLVEKKSPWGTLFDVEDPRSRVPQCKGKFLDVNQALEVARYDIQYCDWRARQDLLTIMLLHEKVSIIYLIFSQILFTFSRSIFEVSTDKIALLSLLLDHDYDSPSLLFVL